MVDSHLHLMTSSSRHRIFVGFIRGDVSEGVHLWIVLHHALVHTVERKMLSVGTPEQTLVDSKLVPVYCLSIDYLTTAVGCELSCLTTFGSYPQLMVTNESHRFRCFVPGGVLLVGTCLSPYYLLFLPVVEDAFLAIVEQHP